ncbi:retrovirus-related pol polyprotein from transposon TNT 1-94 [Tanacetum coccineum]
MANESSMADKSKFVPKYHKPPFLTFGCKVADSYGTHPTLCIPELMRILMDVKGISWKQNGQEAFVVRLYKEQVSASWLLSMLAFLLKQHGLTWFTAFEGPSDTKENRIVDLKLEYYISGLGMKIVWMGRNADIKNEGSTLKTFQPKNKGLVVETFDWDEEEVLDDEEVTQVKVLMALANDELTVGKNHARNGEWIDITMRKLDAVTFQIQNTELTKLNHALQEQLKEEEKDQ